MWDTGEVYKVEVYARVRRAVQVDGMSIRQAAREFGLARKTIRKMLQFSLPPGYERKKPIQRPKLGPWLGIIDQILLDDQSQPRKQRHTAKRIWDRLKAEHAFSGGYTVVKDYVRQARLRHKEVFVPLAHPPGDAQADFGEALVVIAGKEQKAHFQCMDLPHSDDSFVVAFPAENTEAFLEGHTQAFTYFGGVPRTILYDNTRIAVKEITGDGERKPTEAFSALQSHYLFAAKFGRPGKGNDKGNVEGLVGYARRNFMVPVPRAATWEALNAHLLEECRKRRERKLWGHTETIAERFERDREQLLPLPPPLEACQKRTMRVSSQALVRYETNDYSVPVEYGHRQVLLKAFVWEMVICAASEVIARHPRSYDREEMIFNPLHYLALLEQKTNALDQAAPLQNWQLPEEFLELRRQMEARLGKRGRREYVQVLRLLETFSLPEVAAAVRQALRFPAIAFDAVKHLLLCALERRPPKLDLENYPHLPVAEVALTRAVDYQVLLGEAV